MKNFKTLSVYLLINIRLIIVTKKSMYEYVKKYIEIYVLTIPMLYSH